MIEISSYIKAGEAFINIDDFIGKVVNSDYVDGAIEITINYCPIMTKEMWDDINWLWPHLTEGLVKVANGEEFIGSFPSTPIPFSMKKVNSRILEFTVKNTVARISYSEFMHSMAEAGIAFFEKLCAITQNGNSYQLEINRLKKIMIEIERAKK